MEKKVGIGTIGSGSICEIAHFPAIKMVPEAQLIATMDVKEKFARNAAEKWGAKAWYTDYKKLLQRDDIDLVIVASPPRYHHEQAIAAVEAGKHVICEKPMAGTNKEGWEMVEAAKKQNKKLMIGCNQRFWLQNEWAKQLIEKDLIGTPRMGYSELHEHWRLYQDQVAMTPFRYDPKEAGAGALWDVGAHRIDLLVWLMGTFDKNPVKKVVGLAKNQASGELTKCDDTAAVLMELANGAVAYVASARLTPIVSQITEIDGDKGILFTSSESFNPFQTVPLAVYSMNDYTSDTLPEPLKSWRYPTLFWPEDIIAKPMQKKWMTVSPPREWSYGRMVKHFIECIYQNKTPLVKGEDGARVLEVQCAIFKSMETGAWVNLPLKEEVFPPGYAKSK